MKMNNKFYRKVADYIPVPLPKPKQREPILDEEGNEITEPMRKIKDEYMEEYQKTVGELNGKLNEIAYEDNEVDIATIDFDTFIDGLPDESKIDFDDITMLSFMDTTTNVIDDKEVE